MISVIAPIFNESESLEELSRRVRDAFIGTDEEYQFILVDNGSFDDSLEQIRKEKAKDNRIKFIQLTRNFGHQGGILAGMQYASGDALITLDGDLQHPPELIPKMISLWRSGFDVVATEKSTESRKPYVKDVVRRIFYGTFSRLTKLSLGYGQSDFRLIDKKVFNAISSLPEKDVFMRGIIEWLGFRQTTLTYDEGERKHGKSKFSFSNYIQFGVNGIFSFTTLPLKLFVWAGSLILLTSISFILYDVIVGDVSSYPPGWATLVASVLLLSGIQLIGIGILVGYIVQLIGQTRNRPSFIVSELGLD